MPFHKMTRRHPPPASLLESVNTALNADDAASALRLCEDWLAVAPDDPDAQRYLGQILARQGDLEAARAAAHHATELAPNDPRAWSDRGRVWVLSRDWPAAVRCFRQAVSLNADYADGWHNLGVTLKFIGERERALTCLQQALAIEPARAETYLAIGSLLVEDGQQEEALWCFERAAGYEAESPRARNRLAQELSDCGQVDQAEALFRRSLAQRQDDLEAWCGLGHAMEDLGRAELAPACYLNVLKQQPGHGLALGQYLRVVKDESEATSWIAHAHRALAQNDTPDDAKALVGYGLAKYYDRRSLYAEAAQAGLAANAARRRKAGPLNRATLQARIDGIIQTYAADFFSERRRFGIGTDQPVFIVGLPRSGTTLIEQILSAHPFMHGAGELPDLARLAVQSIDGGKKAPWQAAAVLHDEMASRGLAQEYLRALRRHAPPDCPRISDKQPLNYFHLAFTALLFPNARVIHCRRDGRDNALSIWMENFNHDQRYATDFDDLAFFISQERRLMAHWQSVLPLPILNVQYEDVVTDLEGQARRLIDFLGAPWNEACLNFHQNNRAVQTPSRWQVRQPIYNKSVGRWKAYASFLPRLNKAFGGETITTSADSPQLPDVEMPSDHLTIGTFR
ncbi:tetratricopeptide repeat-containing sulfotransferase family protein [Nitrospira sp. KM1]|uniref:tetratricopeptide repeat-containing sulfotransferase family protein n=1 Tax=Nitrospira sp. KM1 TaxID=1936990 RepID=UPI0015632F03|nr:tetratricopeptide repeat-containing sulfotransferase family protein [Nitrospira sp. KM1]